MPPPVSRSPSCGQRRRSGRLFSSWVAIDGSTALIGAYRAGSGGAANVFDLLPALTARWIAPFGGEDDTAANWGGFVPGSVADQGVEIDPDSTQTITGPAGASEIGELQLGFGAGLATLDLQAGGGIIASGDVTIGANGKLQGSGGIIADLVTNAGTIDLIGLGLTANMVNHGLVEGTGTLVGEFVNAAEGEVFAGPGASLVFKDTATNSGTIQGRDTMLRFDEGVENQDGGKTLFSAGSTDVFGKIVNAAGASIVNSGDGLLTLFDNLMTAGEVRTSAGGKTVILRDYSGPGTLTGGGSVFFEGAVSTGASSSLQSYIADIFLTNADMTTMELEGLLRGSDYDA